jgi:hypothetical protein
MNPSQRHQLRTLDRALLALVDERARLLSEVPADDPGRCTSIDDLLRRGTGPLEPDSVRAMFALLDLHCARFCDADRDRGAP